MLPKLPALAKTPGIYGAFRVSPNTAKSIVEWSQENLGEYEGAEAIKADKLHVTTVYCRKQIPTQPLGPFRVKASFARFEVFGPPDQPGTLVAVLSSDVLTDLFNKRRALGAEWDFPEYIPHVTIAKGFHPKDVDDLSSMDFDFVLTEEFFNELDEDFSYDTKASVSRLTFTEVPITYRSFFNKEETRAYVRFANEGTTASICLPSGPPPGQHAEYNAQIMEAVADYFYAYAPDTITIYQGNEKAAFNPHNTEVARFIQRAFNYREVKPKAGETFQIVALINPIHRNTLHKTVWILERVEVGASIIAMRGLTTPEREALIADLKRLPFKVRVLKATRNFVNVRPEWKGEEQVKWTPNQIIALNAVLDKHMLTSVATDSDTFASGYEKQRYWRLGFGQHGYDNVGVKIMRNVSSRKTETTARGESFPTLYHWSPLDSAAQILDTNKIGLTVDIGNKHERSFRGGKDKVYYLSTTRSTLGEYSRKGSHLSRPGVHFVLDKNRVNQRYAIKPIDYWEQGWLKQREHGGGDNYYSREMEDRVYSPKPDMPVVPFVRAIHVYLPPETNDPITPDLKFYPSDDEEMKQRRIKSADQELGRHRRLWSKARKMVLQAARLKIPTFIFTDQKAFLTQDFRKAKKPADVPFLMVQVKPTDDKPWSRAKTRKDDMAEFRELVYKTKIEDLSKRGRERLRSLFSYKDDFINRLDADLHNTRSSDREAAAKMEQAMRQVKVYTSADFYEAMLAKWRPIQDAYDTEYNRKWHADYEKKNRAKIWDNYDPAFDGSPPFVEKARKLIAQAAKPLIQSWPDGENVRYIAYDLAKNMLPILKGVPGIVDAYADINPDDRDNVGIYLLDEKGVNYIVYLESRKYIHSMGHIMDPVVVYPEHVVAAILPHRDAQSFAFNKESARYT